MATITYAQIKQLAADLAGWPPGKLPPGEVTRARRFAASELADLWTREAWPELCDHLELVTLDAEKCFSVREGVSGGTGVGEMGDILTILEGNPLTTTSVQRVESWTRLDGRVHVLANAVALYVDWQTPAPDLLATALDVEATLDAYQIPARFRLPLALRVAARLLADENPASSSSYFREAEQELMKQTARITKPWWRGLGKI